MLELSADKFLNKTGLLTVDTRIIKVTIYINKNFQRKIVNIFLPINFNLCFGSSKEPSH